MSEPERGPSVWYGAAVPWIRAHRWPLAFGGVALLLVVQRLVALDSVPQGLYADEAAIGYNAWAVAHSGIDEHGHSWPLFFQSFDDYKSPIYFYALVPLARFLGLTPAVARFPAALSGILVCAMLSLAAYRITRSRPVALLVLATAAVEPWLVVENRLAFDVNMSVFFVAATLLCISFAVDGGARWFALAGLCIAGVIYGYQTGRLFGGLLWLGVALSFGLPLRRFRMWWLSAVPMAAAYAIMLSWSVTHANALTARFSAVGVLSDSPGAFTLIGRVVSNYGAYWGAPFLATHGDHNQRHATGFGGELLIVTLPAILIGIAVCLRRRGDPLARLLVIGLLLAPLPAALTMEGTPHSVRAALMVPFLVLASAYGWQAMLPYLRDRRLVAGVLVAASVVEAGAFFRDMYKFWPERSALWFEAGLGPAVLRAHQLAQGHEVVISDGFEAAYIAPYFWWKPDPHVVAGGGPAAIGVRVGNVGSAAPGDIIVVGPFDDPPRGAQLLEEELVTVELPYDQVETETTRTEVAASVWRR